MESRRTKSEKTSTPGWNRCDASDKSDTSRQKRTSQRCPLFLGRFGAMASHNGVLADRISSYSKTLVYRRMSAIGGKADMPLCAANVRL